MRAPKADAEPSDDELLALGDLLDNIDFAKHWDQTTLVQAEYPSERRSNLVVVPPSLMKMVRARAHKLGTSTDAVIQDCLRSALVSR